MKKLTKKLFVALFGLVLAGLLTGYLLMQVGNAVPAVTAEPTRGELVESTAVPTRTAVPSPTPTAEPTATAVPTPTATPEPTVWEIAEQMLTECFPVDRRPTWAFGSPEVSAFDKLLDIVYQRHPDLANWSDWSAVGDTSVLIDNGGPPSPFAIYDYQGYPPESYHDSGIFEGRQCDLFLLFFENLPENHDGDGILVGEAFLFYEIGKTGPYKLDGELREVRFVFPPAP